MTQRRNHRRSLASARTRGVALLIAVLIVALLASVSTWLAWREVLAIRRTEDLVASDRAFALALGGEAVAAQGLADTLRNANQVDLAQPWAKPQQQVLGDGAIVAGVITDLQARFNLNDLAPGAPTQSIARWRFQRLLTGAGASPDAVAALVDWMNPVPVASAAGGAGDDYYLGLEPPYRTAAQPFVSASSLRLVRGFGAALVAQLAPEITALPQETTINVNTATAPVLEAAGFNPQQAQAILVQRARAPFASVAQLQAAVPSGVAGIDVAGLGVGSQFFLSQIEVRVGRVRSRLASVLELTGNGRVQVYVRARNATP